MPTRAGMSKANNLSDGDAIFERAYIFYRKNENEKALAEIEKGDEKEARFMELKAQLLYRLERAEEALEVFKKLLLTHSDEYGETRRANVTAVIALLESKKVHVEEEEQLDSFEQMYNYACYLINQEKFGEAIALLDSALVKSRETLKEDGLSEKEIQEELAIIHIQKAFALQMSGAENEAIEIYREIEKTSSFDANVKTVILNNLLAAQTPSGGANAYENLRNLMKKKKSKLTQLQKQTIKFNLALLRRQPVEGEKDESFQEFVTGKLNKRKRKRKAKLPKNYDPNVQPDPERWLPRRERTAYKKKLNKKFKDREIGRGTQGAGSSAGQAAANIDYSKGQSVEPQSNHASPKPTPGGGEGPRQQRPTGAQQGKKGKKKKGGKW